jgi:uncharacterized glyoxalase superfamily protein PhnB
MTSNGLVPLIRYRDVAAAVEWLSQTFGFEKRNVITDPDGSIAYAELSYGRGVVMLGPVGQSVLDSLLKQPDELGGMGTQSVYVAVDDVEAHFKRARSAGAGIVLEFGSEEAGDRAYAARDPEGHIWNFGAYSPWPAAAPALQAAAEPAFSGRYTRGQAFLGGAVTLLAIASVAGLAALDPPRPEPRFAVAPAPVAPSLVAEDSEAAALKETLAREAHARQEAARTAAAVREELARERAGREAAEAARRELERKLAETAPAARPPAAVQPAAAAKAEPAPGKTEAATAPPFPEPAPTETAATPAPAAASSLAEPPATTGSLGEQPRDAALQPTAADTAPPVTVAPATLQQPAAKSAGEGAAKPKPAKPKPQAQKKARPAPVQKKSTGNDPFFMYD